MKKKTTITIAEDNAYEDALSALENLLPLKPNDLKDFEAYMTYKNVIENLIDLIEQNKQLR